MKEDLFKKILILVLLLKGIVSGNDIEPIGDYQYVSINFIPYNASKTSVGINLYDNSYSEYEFTGHNWFTNNLYFSGSFRPIAIEDDMHIKYNLDFGYARNFNSNFFESLVFNFKYQRLRYKNNMNNSYKGILYYFLLSMRIKSVWILPSYGKVDDEYKTNQYGFGVLKSFNNKILLTLGINGYLNDDKDIIIPYISLRYNI